MNRMITSENITTTQNCKTRKCLCSKEKIMLSTLSNFLPRITNNNINRHPSSSTSNRVRGRRGVLSGQEVTYDETEEKKSYLSQLSTQLGNVETKFIPRLIESAPERKKLLENFLRLSIDPIKDTLEQKNNLDKTTIKFLQSHESKLNGFLCDLAMLCEDLEDKEKEYGGICNQKIMIDIIMAHHLMEKIPHNQSGANLMIEQASILIENLQEDKEVAQKTGDTGLAGDVNKLLTELKRFNEYGLKNWGKRVPFSYEKIKNALRLRLEAGFLMLEKAKEAGKDVNHNDKHNKAYQTMHDNLMRLKNKIRTASYPVFLPVNPTGKQIKQVVQPYFDKFRQDLEQALAPMATVSDYNVKTFRRIIDENFTESLNKTGWDPIINEFSVQAKGKEHHLRSQIFPASNIEKILSKDTEDKKCSVKIFASPYQETEGRSCRSNKEDQHAINLAMTTLHIKQPNGKDNRIFCGNRHAVHDHMGITDPVKRKTANKKSAQEGLALAIVSNDTLLEQAKKAQQAISKVKQVKI
ncbi:hypothetical protein CCS41_07770 [Candidatus Fukatsuia symbiotica]|uniref:Uncharacterized protein n=2 Tax=Yersiniaceae TaxID=1903411 RepID=A0A2U8I5H1_9GAMM|nr:hypothetical protein CCS41_07770 [Candidatus Fukatsuia symbiotica]